MDQITFDVATIPRTEWSNEPVLTTAQLAEFFGCSVDSIKMNFKNNRDRFIEGKHYFKIEGADLENLRVKNIYPQISQMTRILNLWTKRGTARHAKMLSTEAAWEVYEALEESYFTRPAVVAGFNPLAQAISELAAVEREKLGVENKKLTQDRDDFAKAQLLRELASASGDDTSARSKFVRKAANLIMGKNFISEKNAYEDSFIDED